MAMVKNCYELWAHIVFVCCDVCHSHCLTAECNVIIIANSITITVSDADAPTEAISSNWPFYRLIRLDKANVLLLL